MGCSRWKCKGAAAWGVGSWITAAEMKEAEAAACLYGGGEGRWPSTVVMSGVVCYHVEERWILVGKSGRRW
jgi:hypothetical protein